MHDNEPRQHLQREPQLGGEPGSLSGSPRVLVVGATGMLGAPVARRLIADGYRVRLLARDPDKARAKFGAMAGDGAGNDADIDIDIDIDIVKGDVTRPDTLIPAVQDCQSLYVSLRGNFDSGDYAAVEGRGLEDLLAAARGAGVTRCGIISGAGNTAGNEHLLPVRIKLHAEELVRNSGIDWMTLYALHGIAGPVRATRL